MTEDTKYYEDELKHFKELNEHMGYWINALNESCKKTIRLCTKKKFKVKTEEDDEGKYEGVIVSRCA